jgi:hypothetical protein
VEGGRPAQRDDQGGGHAGRRGGRRDPDRRGHQHQYHAHLLGSALRSRGRRLPARDRARGQAGRSGLGGLRIREPRGYGGGPRARRERLAGSPGAAGEDRHRQRQADLPPLPRDLSWECLPSDAEARRARPEAPVGQHQQQEPCVPRRSLRGGTGGAGNRQHRASGDTGRFPGPRPRAGRYGD